MKMESLLSGLPQYGNIAFKEASYWGWAIVYYSVIVCVGVCYYFFLLSGSRRKNVVKFRKLSAEAKILEPFGYSAGIDLGCVDLFDLEPFGGCNKFEIRTGIAVEIPRGYCGILTFRSGQYSKLISEYTISCAPGIIDADYRGELIYKFKAVPDNENVPRLNSELLNDYPLQLVVVRNLPSVILEATEELSQTERGTGGYGSTGR